MIRLASGATEQDIVKALLQLTSGGTLVLPKDAVIAISAGLRIDVSSRDITIDLNGSTLQQASNTTVIYGSGTHVAASDVGLSKNAAGDAVVTYANAQASLKVGDWIKVFADDAIPNGYLTGDTPTRLGEALQVKAIDGNKVTLDGGLVYQDLYKTDIRASEYQSGQLVVKNGTVQGDQSQASWKADLVQIRSAVDAKIEHLTVQNGNSMGINVVDSVNTLVQDAIVRNLKDDPSQGYLGYAVHSASSTGTTVVGLYADKVRHATDDNAVGVTAGHPNPSKYGADIGLTVEDSVAYNTTSYSYGWHSEGIYGTVTDSLSFDSYGFVGGRGTGNSVTNSAGANLLKGILLYEYGDGDGRDLTFDNIQLKEVRDYAYFTSGSPVDNTISNSTFEVLYKATSIGNAGTLDNVKVLQGKFVINDLMVGTNASDKLLGGQGKDVILGGAGNDYIWGGAGEDVLTGGSGRDRFAYHSLSEGGDTILDFNPAGDVIDVSVMAAQLGWTGDLFAKGYMRVVQDGWQTLIQANANGKGNDYVTLAKLLGVGATDITADDFQTTISGSTQAETLSGRANPSIWKEESTTLTSLTSYTLGENEQNLSHVGANNFAGTGNDLANTLTGSTGDDRLQGRAGHDRLDGKAGADTLVGGLDNDTYVVNDVRDVVVERSGQGTDRVLASVSHTLSDNVENLTLSTSAAINGTGNGLANVLVGNGGANVLDGKGGADTLTGGAGYDTFVFRIGQTQGDKVTDFTGAGAAAGDHLEFYGFGTGATLTQVATSDSYTITADAAHGSVSETFQLVGVTSLDLITGPGHNDVLLFA